MSRNLVSEMRAGVATQLGVPAGADALLVAQAQKTMAESYWKAEPLRPPKPGQRIFRVLDKSGFRLWYGHADAVHATNGTLISREVNRLIQFTPHPAGPFGEFATSDRGEIEVIEKHISEKKYPTIVDYEVEHEMHAQDEDGLELQRMLKESPARAADSLAKAARALGINLADTFAGVLGQKSKEPPPAREEPPKGTA
jgi:hypothetical protein